MYMRDGRFSGVGIQNLSEIRAPNAEKAGYYLDYALSSRSVDSQVSVSSLNIPTIYIGHFLQIGSRFPLHLHYPCVPTLSCYTKCWPA